MAVSYRRAGAQRGEREDVTRHPDKPLITPERIAWFAAYLRENMAWGIFHASLDDGNYQCGAADEMVRTGTGRPDGLGGYIPARYDMKRDEWPAELREAAQWFDSLTPSQRRRLGIKAERALKSAGSVKT